MNPAHTLDDLPTMAPGWKKIYLPKHNAHYYWNPCPRPCPPPQSQWDFPEEAPPPVPTPPDTFPWDDEEQDEEDNPPTTPRQSPPAADDKCDFCGFDRTMHDGTFAGNTVMEHDFVGSQPPQRLSAKERRQAWLNKNFPSVEKGGRRRRRKRTRRRKRRKRTRRRKRRKRTRQRRRKRRRRHVTRKR